jgi:hypothetical protein
MILKHEAILSLNTRVRRMRYLQKLLDLVSGAPVTREFLAKQLVDYGLSESLHTEITTASTEAFSGHFFEDISLSYDRNIEKRETRKTSNATRVADAYIAFALGLHLMAESDGRLSASQLSFPARFLSTFDLLPIQSRVQLRDLYVLSLLIAFDRDLTCPLLSQLLQSTSGIPLTDIATMWDSWTKDWLEQVVSVASRSNLGNPTQLLRYLLTVSKRRTNPRRYAEHTALLRFHWFTDLTIAAGHPARKPTHFTVANEGWRHLAGLFTDVPAFLILGELAQIYFCACRAICAKTGRPSGLDDFPQFLHCFLKSAQARGMANIRLHLLDIAWCGVSAATSELPLNYQEFCIDLDQRLRVEGIRLMKAPRREDTYLATQR